jgi:hypothetical protein
MMSTNGRGAPEHSERPGAGVEEPEGRGARWELADDGRADSQPFAGGHSGSGSRKRRRRQRSQRGKPRRPAPSAARMNSAVSREGIFQELEGLLRQIREQTEESATGSGAHLNEIVHAVTSFTKSLEEQADPISDRARSEFQRIRDRLSQVLRETGDGALVDADQRRP